MWLPLIYGCMPVIMNNNELIKYSADCKKLKGICTLESTWTTLSTDTLLCLSELPITTGKAVLNMGLVTDLSNFDLLKTKFESVTYKLTFYSVLYTVGYKRLVCKNALTVLYNELQRQGLLFDTLNYFDDNSLLLELNGLHLTTQTINTIKEYKAYKTTLISEIVGIMEYQFNYLLKYFINEMNYNGITMKTVFKTYIKSFVLVKWVSYFVNGEKSITIDFLNNMSILKPWWLYYTLNELSDTKSNGNKDKEGIIMFLARIVMKYSFCVKGDIKRFKFVTLLSHGIETFNYNLLYYIMMYPRPYRIGSTLVFQSKYDKNDGSIPLDILAAINCVYNKRILSGGQCIELLEEPSAPLYKKMPAPIEMRNSGQDKTILPITADTSDLTLSGLTEEQLEPEIVKFLDSTKRKRRKLE